MKNVGIMSMQRIKNYGSFLQAYALKNMIEEIGCSVQFVDYHIDEPIIENAKKKNLIIKGIETLKEDAPLIQKIQYIIHKRNFGKKYFGLLGLTDEKNYNPKLDTLIIGSDEVFNCIQANNNVGYSLELFGKNNNAIQVISYAGSFGNTTIDKINKYNKSLELKELLNKFKIISVRDENSFDIVKKLTGRDAIINLDPVLIYDYTNKIEIPNININEKYIIVYAYSGRISKEESKLIRKYAKSKNLKVYAIGGAQKCADKFIDCSPFEVLAYFKNAECIITDTFHGSIFSIINNKPFVTLVRKSKNNSYGNEEKITYLLKKLELENRIKYDLIDLEDIMSEKINYKKTNSIIEIERKKAKAYLKNNL